MSKIKQVEGLQQVLDSKLDDIQLKSSGELPNDWPNPQEDSIPSQVAIKEYINNTVLTGTGNAFKSIRFNISDNNYTANDTLVDGDIACNLAISEEPIPGTGVRVFINGIYELSGNTLEDSCYFSNDGGVTAKTFGNEELGDLLYWKPSVAGYQLSSITDNITFKYLVYFNVGIIPGGSGTGDLTYNYTQVSPSMVWNITHNLEKYPSVTIVDSSNRVVYGEIEYIDMNTLSITFSNSFAGKAYIN